MQLTLEFGHLLSVKYTLCVQRARANIFFSVSSSFRYCVLDLSVHTATVCSLINKAVPFRNCFVYSKCMTIEFKKMQ